MLDNKDKEIIKSRLTFWDRLKEEEHNLIWENTIKVAYKKDDNLYNSLNDCRGIIIVKSGILRTYIVSEEGKEVTLYLLEEGDICALSASCVLNNITFDVNVDAEKDSEIFLVRLNGIPKIYKNIYVENFLLNEGIARFSDVMWAMQQILFFKFDERLAIYLLDESSRNKNNLIISTHDQIAKHLGSAREVVSRMLKYFSKEGLVELSRGKIKIVNKDDLRQIIKNI
nr:Crp/Fnr family transcriptional regulator [Tissierella sp.]